MSIVALLVHVGCIHYTKMVKRTGEHPGYFRRIRMQAVSIMMVGVVLAVIVVGMLIRN